MTLSLRRPLSALPATLLALVAALALALGFATALTTLTAGPASAHDRLLTSDPADGAQLDVPPAAITLTFNTEPLPVEPTVVVSDSAGAVVTQGAPAIDGSTATLVLDPTVALGGGTYTVAWRVVSSDGHPIEGTFAFTVAAQPEPEPTEDPATEDPETETGTPEDTASEEDVTDDSTETATDAATSGDSADAADGGSSLVPVLVGIGAVVVAAAVVVVLVLRRRDTGTGTGTGEGVGDETGAGTDGGDDAPRDPQA